MGKLLAMSTIYQQVSIRDMTGYRSYQPKKSDQQQQQQRVENFGTICDDIFLKICLTFILRGT